MHNRLKRATCLLTCAATLIPLSAALAGGVSSPWSEPVDEGFEFTVTGIDNAPDLHGDSSDPQIFNRRNTLPDSKTALPNARSIGPDVTSAGQPTEAQIRAASNDGVRTIVNLRPAGEFKDFDEAALAADLGLRYVHIPVAGPDDLTMENAERLHRALASEDDRPAIVHCASGNRVGALTAYRERHILGQDEETAMQKGIDAGLNPDSPMYEATRKALD